MISDFIKKLREDRNLTQEYLAQKLGLSRQTYGLIEKGDRVLNVEEARILAAQLDISLEDFLDEKDMSVSIEVGCSKPQEKSIKAVMRISIPQKNFDKFKEVLLYILARVGSRPNIGETALYKLLYFIDFDYYEKFEEQLIGATYIKNQYGPTPVEFKALVDQMISKGELVLVKNKYFGHDQKKYLPVRDPDLTKLKDAREIKHIDDVLARLADYNASELTDLSHDDVPWIITEDLKPIDYESVFYRTHKTSVRHYDD
jgi:transcriptional regulator with XRE-family HTH domain